MNLHVLQSEEARAEAQILMKVQEHILSPRFGGPVIGAIHDHITGTFMLTHEDPKVAMYKSRYTKAETLSILARVPYKELPDPMVDKKSGEYWTGKQIFSLVLPEDLRMSFKASICRKCAVCQKEKCDLDAFVKIRDGKLLYGTIDEKAIGSFKGKILDKVARDYGSERAREFLDSITRLAIGAIMVRGFTTGIDDEDIPAEATRQIEEVRGDNEGRRFRRRLPPPSRADA
jgi:DNA-directed RNA polymerase subunit A'